MGHKRILFLFVLFLFSSPVLATDGSQFQQLVDALLNDLAPELKLVALLTSLSFLPLVVVATTAFTRIIIVLAMMRHALGLQQTPPNMILIALALFLTMYAMEPVIIEINQLAVIPYSKGDISLAAAIELGVNPLSTFMLAQTSEQSFAAVLQMTQTQIPSSAEELSLMHLVPAFLLSELTVAFKIAFVIFIPFLLIDLVVASTLMSLGMIMVPPITIALPLKVMLFVLVDGWSLLATSLLASFSP